MASKWKAPNPDTEQAFWYFVAERQAAWARRNVDNSPPPWTDDPVISTARFTNVYRELDRGTLFCVCKIMENRELEQLEDVLFHALAYRWFNRIETYTNLVRTFTRESFCMEPAWEGMAAEMMLAKGRGERLYTGAYIATYCPDMGTGDGVVDSVLVLKSLWELTRELGVEVNDPARGSLQAIVARLRGIQGIGPFLSYQMSLDWTYPLVRLRGVALAPYARVNEFVQPGPGAVKGLDLMGVAGGYPSQVRAMHGLAANQHAALAEFDWRPPTTPHGAAVPLSLANVEHSLCEFQKWHRMVGGGHVKTRWAAAKEGSWVPPCAVLPAWKEWGRWTDGWRGVTGA